MASFKLPPQPPLNFNLSHEDLVADTQALIDKTRVLQDEIVSNVTFEHVNQ